ncbi:MAG: hypothetical protein D6767_02930 [Candidatus Hydrogenedentota bacterium]|nr:MAG: hypothetical protein D6767_02930 [Candidatus Hydrogenedentota bacterium]
MYGKEGKPLVFSDGYLGLFFSGGMVYREAQDTNLREISKFGFAQIGINGASPNTEVYTELLLFDNMAYAARQYANKPNYLKKNQIDAFSYSRLLIEYEVFKKRFFHLYGGFEPGHRGYLSPNFTRPVYQLYLAATLGMRIEITDSFLFLTRATLPLSFLPFVYAHNMDNIEEIRAQAEFTYSFAENTINPLPPTVFLSIGLHYSFSRLNTLNYGNWTLQAAELYLKLTTLY